MKYNNKLTLQICLLGIISFTACNEIREYKYESPEISITCGSAENPVQSVILESGAVCTARNCIQNEAPCSENSLRLCEDARASDVFRHSSCPSDEYICTTDSNGKSTCAFPCSGSKTMCHGICTDLQTDPTHCGSCDIACGDGITCNSGVCTNMCPSGQTFCSNECLNFADLNIEQCGSDGNLHCKTGFADCDQILANGCEAALDTTSHCGSCDNACNPSNFCVQGMCMADCPASEGYALCSDECIPLAANHYAKCDTCLENWCDLDLSSTNGCESNIYTLKLAQSCDQCAENWCDLDNNLSNGCEKSLKELNYSECGKCLEGFADCDDDPTNGCEVNLSENLQNCGSCDKVCDEQNICVNGSCALTCPADEGFAKCGEQCIQLSANHYAKCDTCIEYWCDLDKNPANGCEANTYELKLDDSCSQCQENWCDLDNNLANGCEKSLNELNYSECGICLDGYTDCDNDPTNGCEAKLLSDSGNCGTCGNACKEGEMCVQGECISDCPVSEGFAMCGEECIQLSEYHYGKCGTCFEGWCDLDGNADNGCEASSHDLKLDASCTQCQENWCDLDSNLSNGCEKTLSEFHWKECGTCADGYADCDGDSTNGCELKILDDAKNCGACGHACNAHEYCVDGTCVSQCLESQGNLMCDGICVHLASKNQSTCSTCQNNWCDLDENKQDNGCEVYAPDIHLASSCSTCESGWCNLDENMKNGCEVDAELFHVTQDCNGCVDGYCDLDHKTANGCEASMSLWHMSDCETCMPDWCDGNQDLADGCEENIYTSKSNCGACGHACPGNFACINGECIIQCQEGETQCSNSLCYDLSKYHWLDCKGTCEAPYMDCDEKRSNGCEVDISTHDNCGACGVNCGDATCVDGACKCPDNLAWCNGKCVDLLTDKKNCGSCGYDITAVPEHTSVVTCKDGRPVLLCEMSMGLDTKWTDCDGIYETGCEADLQSDDNNCGSCGIKCYSGGYGHHEFCRHGSCF